MIVVEKTTAQETHFDELASTQTPHSTYSTPKTTDSSQRRTPRTAGRAADYITTTLLTTIFVVKMTGRYVLLDDSEFMKTIKHTGRNRRSRLRD
jgi:hypothetical protein